ncbi:MAG: molybdenum cofactor guanylyltransferase [Planctomycetota bacterium]
MWASCVAGVLAGGASRRFGKPKALLQLADGRTFLEHVATVAAEVAAEVVILGEPPGIPPALASVPILPDAEANSGPLGGLCALLKYAAPRWGLLLACDLPALHAGVLRRLLQAAEGDPSADALAFACRDASKSYEACCALYHARVLGTALDLLRSGSTGLQFLLQQVRSVALVPSDEEARALFDVDTPQDLDALRHGMA